MTTREIWAFSAYSGQRAWAGRRATGRERAGGQAGEVGRRGGRGCAVVPGQCVFGVVGPAGFDVDGELQRLADDVGERIRVSNPVDIGNGAGG